VVATRLVRSFVRPLQLVERTARRIAAGERAEAVPVKGDREVASLAASFNWMVDELHRAKERALQTGKMAAVGQLAAGVAHEVNNPLGVILGFAQGLERRVPEGDKLRLPVTSIVREALRCRNLVQELLTFSRTGKKTSEDLDVRELVESTVVLLEPRARSQNVTIVKDLHDVPAVKANATQLQQVIVNLATNAFDAMHDGGTLTIRTRTNDRGGVMIEVADTGAGIPDEIRGRMFEPFFTTKEVGKGTGLGLSLVYEMVRHADGTIDVASTVGKGTTMSIHLPPAAPAVVAA
jgi:two-component system, NtrC family, sensor kinase